MIGCDVVWCAVMWFGMLCCAVVQHSTAHHTTPHHTISFNGHTTPLKPQKPQTPQKHNKKLRNLSVAVWWFCGMPWCVRSAMLCCAAQHNSTHHTISFSYIIL